jgi:hypothetical protein
VKWLLPLLALLLGAAAEPSEQFRPEEVAQAYAAIVELPGEVSLAAATFGDGGPRTFLTKRDWIALETGEGRATPRELLAKLDAMRTAGTLEPMAEVPPALRTAAAKHPVYAYRRSAAAGAASISVLLKNRSGRWLGFAVIWNGDAAAVDEARLAAGLERLILLMPHE